jgi:hypothetical protein
MLRPRRVRCSGRAGPSLAEDAEHHLGRVVSQRGRYDLIVEYLHFLALREGVGRRGGEGLFRSAAPAEDHRHPRDRRRGQELLHRALAGELGDGVDAARVRPRLLAVRPGLSVEHVVGREGDQPGRDAPRARRRRGRRQLVDEARRGGVAFAGVYVGHGRGVQDRRGFLPLDQRLQRVGTQQVQLDIADARRRRVAQHAAPDRQHVVAAFGGKPGQQAAADQPVRPCDQDGPLMGHQRAP